MDNTNVLKFFVTKSGLGYEEGIYTSDEVKALPKSALPYVISLAVAESMGYVKLDHQTGKSINELNAFAGPEIPADKQKKLRGILEGSASTSPSLPKSMDRLGNALRDKLQAVKQNSAEDNLKAQIEAKKKALGASK